MNCTDENGSVVSVLRGPLAYIQGSSIAGASAESRLEKCGFLGWFRWLFQMHTGSGLFAISTVSCGEFEFPEVVTLDRIVDSRASARK